ncbi:MAG: terminase family protein [Alphaproteobacteria bacterium]|nr:terminase family protein [Alphaproteobacteria bacterium]MCL2504823.1 terminase family protein [Alphaproteobacteria bacterium]
MPNSNLHCFLNRLQWLKSARPEQITPNPSNWRIWLILASRGWGKTRTGAEDIAYYALWHSNAKIAVVAPTFADARDTCVEGESGLLRTILLSCIEKWNRSLGELFLSNGTKIKLFSADQPDRLRGPQHHRAWCDELAAWEKRDAFDQLSFGLRLGADPKIIITTTPRNTEMIKDLFKRKTLDVKFTSGKTMDNKDNISPHILAQLHERYAGTRLGRQELDAEISDESEGSFWNRPQIEKLRVTTVPELTRIVIAIDPAMSKHVSSDETGIIAAAKGADGLLYVLSDWSGKYAPDAWAARAIMLYNEMNAHIIVAEVNAGGDLVENIIRQKAPHVLFKSVRAFRNKIDRALPIAALYEQGKVKHVGSLPLLEDQMCNFSPDSVFSSTKSPDRVDALVWALTELNTFSKSEPSIRFL